ncbi:MAG: glycosyltransferase family 4 protein, partial [bacterium]|nr:glycosyltransferase family 4 protein [bacterium]
KKADYVTAISFFLSQKVKEAGYRGRVQIVPNGVDIEKFRNRDSGLKNGRVIISASRRVYKNGLDILEKAFEIVKKKFPDAELRIISDVKYEDIPKYLWEANIFVRPSRSEGLGTAFLEAMAAGLPIIGTPVGGIPDFLKDKETGLFTKVDDPEDLAEKIELLFSDDALRQKLIRHGRKLIEEKYQWSKIARDMEKIFSSLL